jgi:hypothetical protein
MGEPAMTKQIEAMRRPVVVARYENGPDTSCTIPEWREANSGDAEAMVVLEKLLDGKKVFVGGGADPLALLTIEEAQS